MKCQKGGASRVNGAAGAGNRVRTGDLNLGKVALYQLSYSRMLLRVSTAVVRDLMSGVP